MPTWEGSDEPCYLVHIPDYWALLLTQPVGTLLGCFKAIESCVAASCSCWKKSSECLALQTWRSETSFSRQRKVSAGVASSRGSPGAAVPCLPWFLWLSVFSGLWALLLHLCSVDVVSSALGLVHSSSSFLPGQIMVFRPREDDRGRIPNSGKLIHSFGLYVGTSCAKPLCHGRWCW